MYEFDGWMSQVVKSDNVHLSQNLAQGINDPQSARVAAEIKRSGIAAIAFTLPDPQHMAYFNWFAKQDLQALPGKVTISRTRANYLGSDQVDNYMFLPTANVEAMFERARRGETFAATLSDSDLTDAKEIRQGSPDVYNQRMRSKAVRDGFHVVDLEALYKSVYEGRYTTDDGYPIDGSPRGNFFSADGVYPSAIGSAVIANETIKVINRAYKASIPLINVREFAQSLGK